MKEDSEDGFKGFDDDSASSSFLRSVFMNSVAEDVYLMPPDDTITCVSVGVQGGVNDFVMKVVPYVKRPIRVLSLFDGLATGLVVLSHHLGMKVDTYYSSEIDDDALAVQRRRHFGKLIALGDVRNLDQDYLNALGPVDLLLSGSPCDQLTLLNPIRMGLAGGESSGNLFYEFFRIRDLLARKAEEERRPFYWLCENTSKMELATKQAMTMALGCMPVTCCSSSFLPAVRRRLFWGNTPYLDQIAEEMKGRMRETSLQDIVGPYRIPMLDLVPTITSNGSGKGKISAVTAAGQEQVLEVADYEQLLGFAPSYTDVANLSITRRMRLLGKAWCVHVVRELLRPLVDIFEPIHDL